MKIAIIGTGRMARGIGAVLSKAYPLDVGIHSRDTERAKELIEQLQIKAIPISLEAVFSSQIIIHTLWYNDVLEFISNYRDQLKNKIFVDISNPFNEDFTDFVTAFDTSSAEEIQKRIPDTMVVGAFKNTYWVVFDNPHFGGIKSDIYVTGNDESSRRTVIKILQPIPFRIFDGGLLRNNRTIERMTLLEKELATRAGNHPRVSFHLWGVQD